MMNPVLSIFTYCQKFLFDPSGSHAFLASSSAVRVPSTKLTPMMTGVGHELSKYMQISSSLFGSVLISRVFVHHAAFASLQNLTTTSPRFVLRS